MHVFMYFNFHVFSPFSAYFSSLHCSRKDSIDTLLCSSGAAYRPEGWGNDLEERREYLFSEQPGADGPPNVRRDLHLQGGEEVGAALLPLEYLWERAS